MAPQLSLKTQLSIHGLVLAPMEVNVVNIPVARTPLDDPRCLDCFLCDASRGDHNQRPWHDEVLWRSSSAIVVAGVGALVDGYLLVAPVDHVPGALHINDEDARVEFFNSLSEFLSLASDIYGELSIFEHGGVQNSQRVTSACVDHAHIHVIPGRYELAQTDLRIVHSAQTLAELSIIARRSKLPYLMFREPGGLYTLAKDVGVPQFFRRHVAQILGIEHEWDYAAAPRMALVEQTIRSTRASLTLSETSTRQRET